MIPAFRNSFLLLALFLSACAVTKVPMDTLSYPGPASSNKTLVIALRGLGGSVKDFEDYGFVDALHRVYPSYDLICPDAHFGYYRKRSLLVRLQEDVIQPAREKGYEHIYLVGVSLGGLGSLIALRDNPDWYDGVVLLAPYSGDEDLHEAVEHYLAGEGDAPWNDTDLSDSDRSLAKLWQWILASQQLFLREDFLWLGYGTSDRLSGHELLAKQLPAEKVLTMDGGHRATVFVELWQRILAQDPFSSGS